MDALSLSSAMARTFDEINATRYMSAVGLTVLLYDHTLTFADEVDYIWSAPATYSKYVFLLNRYLVLATQLAVGYEMCGFVGPAFTDMLLLVPWPVASSLLSVGNRCRRFIFICSTVAITSVGIANLLTLQRVVILWDHRPAVLKVMTVGFLLSFAGQVTSMVFTLINTLPYISWNSVAGMCVATKASRILIAVWACPMIFELFVLVSTALNALDRPRGAQLPIHKALQQDGIQFFVLTAVFRVINIVFATIGRPSLTFLAVFFIWAMTTTTLSRLLLHLRRTECRPPPVLDPTSDEFDPALARALELDVAFCHPDLGGRPSISATLSPFGLVPLTRRLSGTFSDESLSSPSYARGKSPMRISGEDGSGYGCHDSLDVIAPGPGYHYKKRTHDPNPGSWA